MKRLDSASATNGLRREQLLEIEKACDLFESDLREGEDPETAELQFYVDSVASELQESLRKELLRIRADWIEKNPCATAFATPDTGIVRAGDTLAPVPRDSVDGETASWLLKRFDGRFNPLEQLGSGASGVVWKVYDTRLNRVVAIKIPHVD